MTDDAPIDPPLRQALRLGAPLCPEDALARHMRDSCRMTDPWVQGKSRFASTPVEFAPALATRLDAVTRDLAALFDAAVQLAHAHDAWVSHLLHPPAFRAMAGSLPGFWHGWARLDLFPTTDGRILCAEINADTPSGQAETEALARWVGERSAVDPDGLRRRFLALVDTIGGPRQSIGIVFPTELPEDLALIARLRAWLEDAGHRVVVGSPFNLTCSAASVRLLGARVDTLVRHYKTDWWGERQSVWRDGPPYPDAEPLDVLGPLLDAVAAGRVTVINPFGAIVAQDKRLMAWIHDHLDRLPEALRAVARRHLPLTRLAGHMDPDTILAEQSLWVLKSDFGCEGDEVRIGARMTPDAWADTVARIDPDRWVVQERFEGLDIGGAVTNLGAWVVGGEPAGWYARLDPPGGQTTRASRSAPIVWMQ